MNETPMWFELPATRTLEFTGNKTVPVLSCGADKQSFTVALTVKANGEKLPPKVIFKGVRQLKISVPPRMQVSIHKKGWMDEEGKACSKCRATAVPNSNESVISI